MREPGFSYDKQTRSLALYSQDGYQNWVEQFPYPYNKQIAALHIGSAIKSIYTFQFEKCSELRTVSLSSGLQYIGEYSLSANQIRSIVIPGTVQNISHCAFCQCERLENIQLTDGIIRLEDYVFSECKNLTNIKIPSSVVCLDENALTYSGIKRISGARGSVAEAYAHKHDLQFLPAYDPLPMTGRCGDSLTWEYIPDTKELMISGTGDMWNYGWKHRSPWRYFPVKSVQIQSGCTSIGRCAFLQCFTITEIYLPATVTFIYHNAFEGTPELQYIHIPAEASIFHADDNHFYQGEKVLAHLKGSIYQYLDRFDG